MMTDRKFTNLRKRLDQLGYRQALGIESVPLVEKLFTDLVHTTESLKNVKLQLSKRDKERTTFEDNAEPYKSDNAKLVRENNDLHVQLIRAKEEGEHAIKELKSSLRKIEHENADLKFLNTQYVHKVKALEKDSSEKTLRISELQEKNLHAVVETPGGRKKQIPTRRQRMDIKSTLSSSDRSTKSASSYAHDPYVADLLNVADSRIEQMQGKMNEMENEREAMERRNKTLRRQVEHRDKEIERLGHLLEGGRPLHAVMKDTRQDSSDKVVAHLNVQVDYLQQANKDLEKRIKESSNTRDGLRSQIKDLSEDNEQLQVKIKKLEKKKHVAEEQRDKVATIAVQDADEAKIELRNVEIELEKFKREVAELRKERQRCIEECERLGDAVSSLDEQKDKLERLLENCEEEKVRLGERNAKLASSEHDLIISLEKLRSKKSPSKTSKSPSKHDGVIKSLEKQLDYYKEECASLQEMVKKKLVDSAQPSPRKKGKSDARWQSMLRIMEEERDYYKTEYETLRKKKSAGKSPTSKEKMSSSTSEVARLRRERDDLQALLEKFEKHLADIQENVKTVVSDRDSVQLLYEQATEEIQRLRRQVTRSRSPSPSRTVSSIISRVEAERDEALADLRRASSEVESLQEQLKVRTDSAVSERRRHQQSIADLESALEKLEKDKRDAEMKVASLKKSVSDLDEQLRQTSSKFVSCRDTTLEREAEANKMRLIAEQAERSVEDCQRQLARKNDDLRENDEKLESMEERIDEMEKVNSALRQDIVKLRGTVKSLDIEKDNLQQQVDEKTERVMALEARRTKQDKNENELKLTIDDLEAKLQHALSEVDQKQREIKTLKRDMDRKDDDLGETTRLRDAVSRENKRVQEDLVTMTAENQAVHQELEQSLQEQETLKIQIREYTTQVARFEELLAQKDLEKEELLEQFRALSSEAEKLVTDARVSEGQVSNYKTELRQKMQDDLELRERLRSLQVELDQLMAKWSQSRILKKINS
ncbi:centrosomal protein of 135 kDa-like isoform X2 [Dendronephthya gigantea]|uniref:centrosomal protein of 135 kDa-like isoform X2 n=1 Tax=Dendronephthya gigantea TaxID=151771 RepID=UPI00106D9CE4|nr:centrosomal protein of 135 kDa-like isoform X2 [Dendronephthya gigantea]